MVLEIVEPNTCVRGCCRSETIPLHLLHSSYSLSSPIAKGAESVVYEGILDGKKVAIKKPVLSTSDDLDKFHKELQLLSKLDHPGIIKLLAAHAKPPNYMFFFELYEAGNLLQKLHVEEESLNVAQVIKISSQLANSLLYLHNLGVVHRDVKPANILLTKNLHPHLADFGLAEYKNDLKQVSVSNWKSAGKPTGGFHKKNMVGTLIYMAPEVLQKAIHTEKSDVYSFSVTVNELLTGVVPYTDLRAEAQAHTVLEMHYTEQQLTAAVVSQGLRPVLAGPELNVPARLQSLIQKCWDADPDNRPSFEDIVFELDAMLDSVESKIDKEDTFAGSVKSFGHSDTTSIGNYEEPANWFARGRRFCETANPSTENIASAWLSSKNADYRPVLSSGSFSTTGRRENMEDTHFMIPNFCNERDVHLFGIFDGHRGAEAAEYSAGALPNILQSLASTTSPSEALREAFLKTDTYFRNEMNSCRKLKHSGIQKDRHPGCTAVAALINKDKVFVANAGDCRAILCRSGNSYTLTRDLVASCPDERERIIRAGGEVVWQVDTWRVGRAALQVTRSIGDNDLKPFVTAEPEITETSLSAEDEYMVMASDGLWDAMSNSDVIGIIKDTVKEPGMCAKRLATEAIQRGSKDNITVIVVFLRPVMTAERIY
ncbi:protein kinase and PP2C-like domain-containing protein [Andrographis paniculata]|uniref:protein kinase and PP2C-like domain-containing protein n=1 Tax=Andrographis paniculata TaxID=175694 RepID=UPI0021E81CB4|nr:protein kinase and PP2C-like domain-containing protein [Andrographis paniculata]